MDGSPGNVPVLSTAAPLARPLCSFAFARGRCVQVRLNWETVEFFYFDHYRVPSRKLVGGKEPIYCREPGHNACMPDCRDPDAVCEVDPSIHDGLF